MTLFCAAPLPSRGISVLLILFVQPDVEGLEELQDGAGTHFPVRVVILELAIITGYKLAQTLAERTVPRLGEP